MKINKITYISCSSIPSAYANSVHVMKMCNSFTKMGVDAHLVCKQSENWVDVTDAKSSYGCKSNLKICAFSSHFKGKLYSISYILYAMRKVITAKGVIYARYLYPLIPLFFSKKHFILEFHNDLNGVEKKIAFKLMNKQRCKLLVFISEALKDLFVNKYSADPNKCVVLPDACDISDEISEVDNDAIGYVGHLYKGRGIELLIEIAKQLPNNKFHLIGGKEPELSYYKSISPSNMVYYGSVKHSELPTYYSKFKIALAPYQEKIFAADMRCETSSYCSPMKLFEYMSYKKTILCSDLPVFHEVGENGKELLFLPANDANKWVDAIRQLLEDSSLAEEISNKAYDKFTKYYTWDSRVKRIINFLKE